eukprot:scaffold197923_cov36-Tisochrysis_lutea.AAC.2
MIESRVATAHMMRYERGSHECAGVVFAKGASWRVPLDGSPVEVVHGGRSSKSIGQQRTATTALVGPGRNAHGVERSARANTSVAGVSCPLALSTCWPHGSNRNEPSGDHAGRRKKDGTASSRKSRTSRSFARGISCDKQGTVFSVLFAGWSVALGALIFRSVDGTSPTFSPIFAISRMSAGSRPVYRVFEMAEVQRQRAHHEGPKRHLARSAHDL